MIQVKNKSGKKPYYFPIGDTTSRSSSYSLLVFNSEYSKELQVTDKMTYNNYYEFHINFKDFPDGEYKYILYMQDKEVSRGLIAININYNKQIQKIYEP